MNLNAGLDKARLLSNILMIILVMGNIFFSIQYIANIQQQAKQDSDAEQKATERLQTARFMKYFIDTVLNTKGTVSFEDRVKLENDVRQLHDSQVTAEWDIFVASKDSKAAQEAAVKLMSMLSSKML